ncbi:HlyB/MsbA family ABC transporter [Daedaleopsis nitida]|nr:HlyB/MsbA family ABC transporter [Daedaleopsis nitida]
MSKTPGASESTTSSGLTGLALVAQRYPGRIVRHHRVGVWDVYMEDDPDGGRIAFGSALAKKVSELTECAPYLVRMIRDVLDIPGCKLQVAIYAISDLVSGVIPAVSLLLEGELVGMASMDVALETRTVDTRYLLSICAGRIACTVATIALSKVRLRAEKKLSSRIRRWFALRSFRAYARLDVPTFGSTPVQQQLAASADEFSGNTVVWDSVRMVADIVSSCAELGANCYMLLRALSGQKDGRALALVMTLYEALPTLSSIWRMSYQTAWACSTSNLDYMKMLGWKAAIKQQKHRKEIVAGNLTEYATQQYQEATERVGDDDTNWTEVLWSTRSDWWGDFQEVLTHLPQVVFTLHAIQNPLHMPELLASLNLVQTAARSFSWSTFNLFSRFQSVGNQLVSARDVYEAANIVNMVPDGTVAFPQVPEQVESGVSLEFRNVSFRYPDTEKYALRNVSFALRPGQLCVIVGSNGAGKSTVLKLTVRLFDPEEGQILIGGHDIRTLKLHDLRRAISVLFQDYTHFPLSIRDNIALGDPSGCGNETHIRLAARLGGAEAFIEKLPEGFDTYLQPPAAGQCSGPSPGSKTLFGNTFDICPVRDAAGIRTAVMAELSGGQMQRLAVARTFMRSVVREDADAKLGLLLFDEPSASLDPGAEHDLFDRLRELRGKKTMVFSTHRFGNLTRHADLILYMNESGILESGTHDELLKRDGEYARLWKLQAQAFI